MSPLGARGGVESRRAVTNEPSWSPERGKEGKKGDVKRQSPPVMSMAYQRGPESAIITWLSLFKGE
ncbi:hypothetical protein WQ57_10965 [Mesobacillus campisalis]|uniref:Uncharacterized protein n=1 Tax=Mesobacillus campisalis TaxID=1408103 RepID=A0A0M2STV1_9BACI|nr:hypothetical protein WQ57_10965 [Mesobacillus campisalis]